MPLALYYEVVDVITARTGSTSFDQHFSVSTSAVSFDANTVLFIELLFIRTCVEFTLYIGDKSWIQKMLYQQPIIIFKGVEVAQNTEKTVFLKNTVLLTFKLDVYVRSIY